MRKSKRHEYRQATNAQAVVDADGSQPVAATNVSRSPADGPTFAATIEVLCATLGPPATVLGDAGFASGEAVGEIEARAIEVLVAVSRPEAGRRYDFRPPPGEDAKPPPEPKAAWRRKMQEKMGSRRCQSQIQEAQIDRRAGLRHSQERPRLHPLPAPRPRQRQDRMAARHPRLQLQAPLHPEGRLTGLHAAARARANDAATRANPTDC